MSTPEPPVILSIPEPPVILSAPPFPVRTFAPLPPAKVSPPPPPMIVSSPAPPVTTNSASFSAVPVNVRSFVDPRPLPSTVNSSPVSSIVASTRVRVLLATSFRTSFKAVLITVLSNISTVITSERVILSPPAALMIVNPSICASDIVSDCTLLSAEPAESLVSSRVSKEARVSSEKSTAVVPPATTRVSVPVPPVIVSPAPVASAALLR